MNFDYFVEACFLLSFSTSYFSSYDFLVEAVMNSSGNTFLSIPYNQSKYTYSFLLFNTYPLPFGIPFLIYPQYAIQPFLANIVPYPFLTSYTQSPTYLSPVLKVNSPFPCFCPFLKLPSQTPFGQRRMPFPQNLPFLLKDPWYYSSRVYFYQLISDNGSYIHYKIPSTLLPFEQVPSNLQFFPSSLPFPSKLFHFTSP